MKAWPQNDRIFAVWLRVAVSWTLDRPIDSAARTEAQLNRLIRFLPQSRMHDLSHGWHARSFTRLACTLFNTTRMHALYHSGPIMTTSQCEFDSNFDWHIDILSSSCELDRHISMLSSSCDSEVEFNMHITIEAGT